MTIAAVCPECQSLFRVPLHILDTDDGIVECGQCNHQFIGVEHLIIEDGPIVQKKIKSIEIVKLQNSNAFLKYTYIILISLAIIFSFNIINIYSLNNIKNINPNYRVFWSDIYYRLGYDLSSIDSVESLNIQDTLLKKTDDRNIWIRYSLQNNSNNKLNYPLIEISLLDKDGYSLYNVISESKKMRINQLSNSINRKELINFEALINYQDIDSVHSYRIKLIDR